MSTSERTAQIGAGEPLDTARADVTAANRSQASARGATDGRPHLKAVGVPAKHCDVIRQEARDADDGIRCSGASLTSATSRNDPSGSGAMTSMPGRKVLANRGASIECARRATHALGATPVRHSPA